MQKKKKIFSQRSFQQEILVKITDFSYQEKDLILVLCESFFSGSHLRQVSGFLQFPPPINLTATI
jgi:hypothetical protein